MIPQPRDRWGAVEAAFDSLGRVVLVLDEEFRVQRASANLDQMVCAGASTKIGGRAVADLLGESLFGPSGSLRQSLLQGGREEGRRGFLRCLEGGSRLVSLSASRMPDDLARGSELQPGYLVVIRPAESDALILQNATAGMGLVARSHLMQQIVRFIEALQASVATVLITGESGTGKEVVARAVHANSPKREGPFIPVNMAAIPSELLESELFGHVRGAFTGAATDRVGRFELARGGTLFLDEIGDTPLPLQVKLLRVIEEARYTRLGESESRPMDARIVAATNVDLERSIALGQFREDLFYRLRVVPIHVPPLRERLDEIEPLARHLLARMNAREGKALMLSPDVLRALAQYDWPGNVRQLENALEHAVAICPGQTLGVEHLPAETLRRGQVGPAGALGDASGARADTPSRDMPSRAMPTQAVPTEVTPTEEEAEGEPGRIRAALESHRWNRERTAKALDMSRTTLWRKMREYGIA